MRILIFVSNLSSSIYFPYQAIVSTLVWSETQIELRQTVDDLSLITNCSDTLSEGNKGLL